MMEATVLEMNVYGGYQGGADPWKSIASIKIDSDGYHETHLVGRSGDRAPLNIAQVADFLAAEFEPASLLALIGHIKQLHETLQAMAAR